MNSVIRFLFLHSTSVTKYVKFANKKSAVPFKRKRFIGVTAEHSYIFLINSRRTASKNLFNSSLQF